MDGKRKIMHSILKLELSLKIMIYSYNQLKASYQMLRVFPAFVSWVIASLLIMCTCPITGCQRVKGKIPDPVGSSCK
jgi:ABC-type polysaccharide transport system permease subunit